MDLLPIVIFTICLAIPSNSMETNIYTNTIQLQRGGKYIKVRPRFFDQVGHETMYAFTVRAPL